jgi:outer membrane protein assembly factor BamB
MVYFQNQIILAASGAVTGSLQGPTPSGSAPAIGGDGTVYVCGSDSNVHAYNGQTGALKWSAGTCPGCVMLGSLAIGGDGVLYVAAHDQSDNTMTFYAFA